MELPTPSAVPCQGLCKGLVSPPEVLPSTPSSLTPLPPSRNMFPSTNASSTVFPTMLPVAVTAAATTSTTTGDVPFTAASEVTLPEISFPAYMQGMYTAWCLVLLLLGLVGNLLVPVLVLRDRDLRQASTSVFIMNLVVADMLVLVVCLPALLFELYAPPDVWVLPPSMCKVVPYVEFTVAHASMLTILAISVERYRAICHPLTAAATCSRARAALACILVWLLATSVTSPFIALTEYHRTRYVDDSIVPVCYTRIDKDWAKVFVVSSMVVLFFLPLVVLVVLYWRIAKQLLLEDQQLCRDKPNPNLQARKQVVVMLGTVVVVFFVCLLPYRVFCLWIIFTSKETEQSLGEEVHFNLLYATRVLVYVNSAINPVLYNVTSSKFRGAFFRLMGVGGSDRLNSSSNQGTTTATTSSLTSKGRHPPWRRSQRLLLRSYTCFKGEGETKPLVDRNRGGHTRAATWATPTTTPLHHTPTTTPLHHTPTTTPLHHTPTTTPLHHTPASSPFLVRAPSCTRDAVKEAESFV